MIGHVAALKEPQLISSPVILLVCLLWKNIYTIMLAKKQNLVLLVTCIFHTYTKERAVSTIFFVSIYISVQH